MDEKIEVGYRKIGEVLGKDYHHKFLIYTDKEGAQHTISGWTGGYGAWAAVWEDPRQSRYEV